MLGNSDIKNSKLFHEITATIEKHLTPFGYEEEAVLDVMNFFKDRPQIRWQLNCRRADKEKSLCFFSWIENEDIHMACFNYWRD